MIGTKLADYEITSHLGKGGMGEVYQATDTKLGRSVAIKLLPAAFASDPDRLSRFRREAQLLASLNHPNIAHIYGLEESGDTRCIVMELIEGETLQARIKKGSIPVDEALVIAKQIAEALEAAHEKGVIHRDLKPGNVMLTSEGRVKVLDFGMAKSYDANPGSTTSSNSPTMASMAATNAGVILGTAAYMSPEQAKGRPVDKRTDIFAFGCVLYEMLTGRAAFDGENVADILSRVLQREPDWTLLPANVPPRIRELLRLCLEKNAKNRRSDATDVRLDIEQVLAEPVTAIPATPTARVAPLAWIACAAATLVAVVLAIPAVHYLRETSLEPRVLQFTIAPPENSVVDSFELSSDGRSVVIAAAVAGKQSLWTRSLDTLELRAIPGTEGAVDPFWSPDSRSIGFFAGGKLKKIAVKGGPPQTLADAIGGGGAWSRKGVIVYRGINGNLFRIAESGAGDPSPWTTSKLVEGYPFFLADGRRFLYSIIAGPEETRGIYLGSLDSSSGRRLLSDPSNAQYMPPERGSTDGHLLFFREGTLMAEPVDSGSLQTAGETFPVAEQVALNRGAAAQFSVSEDGTLLYRTSVSSNAELVWLDREGNRLNPSIASGRIQDFALSPDGERIVIAIGRRESIATDLWIQDLERGMSKFTFSVSRNVVPVWSPDGLSIVFSSSRSGRTELYQKLASGAAQEQSLLMTGDSAKLADDISHDGKFLLYEETGSGRKTRSDVLLLALGGADKPVPILQSEFNESHAQLSADGRWLAYVSDESGRDEVYVQPFASDGKPAPKSKISTSGGRDPRWRRDGSELYYVAADQKLMRVPVKPSAGAAFSWTSPQKLFEMPPLSATLRSGEFRYAVSSDGKRFLVYSSAMEGAQPPIIAVTNWQAGLKK